MSGEGKSKDFVWRSDYRNLLLNCIVSAQQGMLVEFAAGRDEEARQRSKHVVYFGPQELRIYAYPHQSRFTQAGWGLMVTFDLRCKIGEDPQTLKPRQFGAGYRFNSAVPGGPSRFLGRRLDMPRCISVPMAHEKAARQEWNGHELTIVTTSSCIRLDERTGQLLESRLFERGSEDEVLTGTVAEKLAPQQRLEQVGAETANWSAFPNRERGLQLNIGVPGNA